jgi:hypothetical protein
LTKTVGQGAQLKFLPAGQTDTFGDRIGGYHYPYTQLGANAYKEWLEFLEKQIGN